MEFVNYKAIRGYYGGKEEVNIIVPKGIKFLFKDESIGPGGTHIGHNNYVFFVKNTNMTEDEREELLDKSDWLCSYKLGDVYVFTIDNVKFIDKIPVYENYLIPMYEFDFNNMYILHKTPDIWPKEIIDKIYNGTVTLEEIKSTSMPGRVFAVSKILAIMGPNDIVTFDVICGTYLDDREAYGMNVVTSINIEQIAELENYEFSEKMYKLIATKDNTEFERIKNKVLDQITNYKI